MCSTCGCAHGEMTIEGQAKVPFRPQRPLQGTCIMDWDWRALMRLASASGECWK